MTLLAMVLAVAVALPSFAQIGDDEPDESVVAQTVTVPTTAASDSEEVDDDDAEEEEKSEDEGSDEDDGEGSERSAEVAELLVAGCNPGRGIGNKVGHENNGKLVDCDLPSSVHPVHGVADSESETDHPGQGRGRSKDKKAKAGVDRDDDGS